MRSFLATYSLHSGQSGRLHITAACSCDAVQAALDALGDQLAVCRVRLA